MDEPLVSVIIPVYNGERFVATSVESVLNQSYENLEIIAVYREGKDNSLQVLKKYGDKITIIVQESKGLPAARNDGMEASRGEYVAFLDCDDIWHQDKLKTHIQSHLALPEVLFSFSNFKWFEWKDRIFHALSHSQIYPIIYDVIRGKSSYGSRAFVISKAEMFYLSLQKYWPGAPTIVCHRHLFDLIGPWNEAFNYNSEWDLGLRATRVSDFLYIDEALVDVGRHDLNMSKDLLKQDEGDINVLDLHLASSLYTIEEKKELLNSKGRLLCGLGYSYLAKRHYQKARQMYREALRIRATFLHALLRLPFTFPPLNRLRFRGIVAD